MIQNLQTKAFIKVYFKNLTSCLQMSGNISEEADENFRSGAAQQVEQLT